MRVHADRSTGTRPAGDAGPLQARHCLLHDAVGRARAHRSLPATNTGSTPQRPAAGSTTACCCWFRRSTAKTRPKSRSAKTRNNGSSGCSTTASSTCAWKPERPAGPSRQDHARTTNTISMRQAGTISNQTRRHATRRLSRCAGHPEQGRAVGRRLGDLDSRREPAPAQPRGARTVSGRAERTRATRPPRRAAKQVRREAEKKQKQAQRNYLDMRNIWANPWRRAPVTMALIVLSALVFFNIFRELGIGDQYLAISLVDDPSNPLPEVRAARCGDSSRRSSCTAMCFICCSTCTGSFSWAR